MNYNNELRKAQKYQRSVQQAETQKQEQYWDGQLDKLLTRIEPYVNMDQFLHQVHNQ